MKKGKKLYEGKAKKLYSTDEPNQLIQEFKNDAVVSDGTKKGTIKGKGAINNQISAHLFKYLESYNVPTHFMKTLSDTEMLIKRLDIIPVEVVVRNIAAGSLCKTFGVEEGQELPHAIVEYYLKDDERHDPMINEDHVIAFGHATAEDVELIRRMALKINAVLKSFFLRRDLQLVDFKLEFGRYKDKILLGDEISPDTCRFWDIATGEKLDKDRFRHDLSQIEETYQEIHRRILG